jgi:hypothetical protein
MTNAQESLQTVSNHAHAILMENFRQPETGLLYMYIDPHEVGRINMPTREQVEACIPNSNGFATPIENSNYATSQYVHTLIARQQVTQKPEHAKEVRQFFNGLMLLRKVSSSPTFVPRGVLGDRQTHYVDVSVDHMSFWIMGMWSYYRCSIATVEERQTIREELLELAKGTQANDWKFCREDGKLSYWSDLLTPRVPRTRLVLLMLLGVVYDMTEDKHWRQCYEDIRGTETAKVLNDVINEYTWISSQTAWLLDTLLKLEKDPQYTKLYRQALIGIAQSSVEQLKRFKEYDAQRAWVDFTFRGETYRDVMFGLVGLALCPDAQYIAEHRDLAEQAIRHYNHRRDAKIVDSLDSIPRYYWLLAQRGLLPYDAAMDLAGDGTIYPIPAEQNYPYNFGHWFNSLTREYTGHAPDEDVPQTQFEYVIY